uniref:Uncharacterized protein n=1 Tax=Arundo donax TaxID=35708 RepID=A0A0A9BBL7_ARUDO
MAAGNLCLEICESSLVAVMARHRFGCMDGRRGRGQQQ